MKRCKHCHAVKKNHVFDFTRWMELKSIIISVYSKTYLKIRLLPKGKSEAVHRRGIDNTMAKRKRAKEQTTIYKIFHKILRIQQEDFEDIKVVIRIRKSDSQHNGQEKQTK